MGTKRLEWTPEQDAYILNERRNHRAFDIIAAALGVSRSTVVERYKKLGERKSPTEKAPARSNAVPIRNGRRQSTEALQAGHPTTWGALIAGTILEGRSYPLPIFAEIPEKF